MGRGVHLVGAAQCGFCSPGIVMKAEAFLGRRPAPTRDEIARALAGNLCRCGLRQIIDAIRPSRPGAASRPPAAAAVGDGR
jgi:aerobic-type carbon monoxide dehydrogenase small subunit (CoxS/CutS family)